MVSNLTSKWKFVIWKLNLIKRLTAQLTALKYVYVFKAAFRDALTAASLSLTVDMWQFDSDQSVETVENRQ